MKNKNWVVIDLGEGGTCYFEKYSDALQKYNEFCDEACDDAAEYGSYPYDEDFTVVIARIKRIARPVESDDDAYDWRWEEKELGD